MPRPLDLTGRRFGRLEAIRYDGEHCSNGQRLWVCLCECGSEVRITIGNLTSGQIKSCGCLRRDNAKKLAPLANKALKDEFAAKERIFDDGEEFFASIAAVRYLGVRYPRQKRRPISLNTLYRWKDKCPWLNGGGLVTRLLKGAHGREHEYFAKRSLDDVIRARAQQVPEPEVADHVPFDEAARDLGWSRHKLRERLNVEGRVTKKVRAKRRNGFAGQRAYVSESFVSRHRNAAPKDPKPPGKVTIREAADIAGISVTAGRSRKKSKRWVGSSGRAVLSNGHAGSCTLLSRSDIEKDATPADPKPPDKVTIHEGAELLNVAWTTAWNYYRQGKLNGSPGLALHRRWGTPTAHVLLSRAEVEAMRSAESNPAANGQPTPAGTIRPAETARPQLDLAQNLQPTEAGPGTKPQRRRGRKPDPVTAQMQQCCWELYVREGKKAVVVRAKLEEKFPNRAPQDDPTVRLYAERHARKHGLTMDRPGREKV